MSGETGSGNEDPVAGRVDQLAGRVDELVAQCSKYITRAEKRNKWKDVRIPAFSVLVVLMGIAISAVVQVLTLKSQAELTQDTLMSQAELTQYEVTFLAKQKAYANLMTSIHALFHASKEASRDVVDRNVDNVQSKIFAVQPFLSFDDQNALWEDGEELITICLKMSNWYQANKEDRESLDPRIYVAQYFAQRGEIR